MLPNTSDFRIKAENFDLTKGANLVRIAAGAFMFPHVAGSGTRAATSTPCSGPSSASASRWRNGKLRSPLDARTLRVRAQRTSRSIDRRTEATAHP